MERLQIYIKKNQRRVICVSLIIGFLLTVILSFTLLKTFYYKNVSGPVDVSIMATGVKDELSWGTDVRIESIIVNDENPVDLNSLELTDGWFMESNLILSNKSTKENPKSFNLRLDNVKNIAITFAMQEGSGYVEVNAYDKISTINLYNKDWQTTTWLYTNYSLQPIYILIIEFLALFLVIQFFLMWPVYIIISKNSKAKKIVNYIILIDYILVIPFIFSFFIQLIQFESVNYTVDWVVHHFTAFILGYLYIVLIYCKALCIGQVWIATAVTGAGCFLLASVNFFKDKFRNEPLLPWDLLSVSELKSIMPQLDIQFTKIMIIFIFICISLILYSYYISVPKFKKRLTTVIIRTLMFFSLLLINIKYVNATFYNEDYLTELNITNKQWKISETYHDVGLLSAFMINMKLFLVETPKNYSVENMQLIEEKIVKYSVDNAKENIASNKNPNIIVIMSEGFWDVTELPGIDFNNELLPTFNVLKENYISGYMFTSKFGGGTSNVEFEVLTGFANQFLLPNSVPYIQYTLKPTFSLAQYLKIKGYSTLAIHSYNREFWNRDKAYKNLSFDNYFAADNFIDPEKERGYISDMEISKEIIKQYEANKTSNNNPLFNFTVTMENHMPYSSDNWNEEDIIKFEANHISASAKDGLKDLATGLNRSDAALGYLIDYFKNIDEPTIIVFFGDHMNSLGDSINEVFEDTGYLKEGYTDLESEYEMYKTPIVIWNNYTEAKSDIGVISSFQVMPTVMEIFNLDMPLYFSFLNEIKTISKGYTRNVVLDENGNPSYELNNEQKNIYDMFNLIQYDHMFGNRYLDSLFR